MATIVLKNAHGHFEVRAEVLEEALRSDYGNADVAYVRQEAAARCGHPKDGLFGLRYTAFDDCSRLECLIMMVDSGNHSFGPHEDLSW